jgi:ABC-type branched-subunit amino acid transport system ATPase component
MLKIEDLTVRFGTNRIINSLKLEVQSGQALGIIGPNGCGKTTLFNAISGFVPCFNGSIFWGQHQLENLAAHQRASLGIARVFQNSGVFKELTVAENMIIALESKSKGLNPIFSWGSRYKKYKAEAKAILEEVKLDTKLEEKAASLSGGQLRLLEISRAVAFGADLFLLDEPTAGVSPKMKDEVVAAVKRLSLLGKTILIIEHDINLIDRFCEKVVVLDAGQVVLEGTPMEVRQNPALQEVYFGISQA